MYASIQTRQSKAFILVMLISLLLLTTFSGCNRGETSPVKKNSPISTRGSSIKVAAKDQIQKMSSVAFSKDGNYALSGSEDHKIRLWDLTSGELIRIFSGHTDVVTSISFSPTEPPLILSGSKDNTMRLWERNSGKLLYTFDKHSNDNKKCNNLPCLVKSVSFSPNGRYALSGSYDKTMQLWDISDNSLKIKFEANSDTVRTVAFSSPNGNYVASGSEDKIVRLWKTKTGHLIHLFSGHKGTVNSVVFSPDGNSILSGSADKIIRLWDVNSGKLLRTFKGHSDEVYSVNFSQDGRYVLSGGWDKTVRLWDANNGELLRIFKGHTGDIFSVSFSPDGNQILSGGNDGIFLWEHNSSQHIAQIIVFKDDEWVTFMPKGFFVASPNGGQKLSIWIGGREQSDNSPHHRPDKVKETLAGTRY